MVGRFDSPDPLAHVKPWNSPYAFCGGDPINRTDPTGLNDFYHRGVHIGSDNEKNGIVWVVPEGTKNEKDIVDNIKQNNGKGSSAWEDIKDQCVNTNATIEMIEEMLNYIGDDFSGGDAPQNNREYGGLYYRETVTEEDPGPITDPSSSSSAGIRLHGKRHSYHSHPSGEINGRRYMQPPSEADFNNAAYDGNYTRMVFAMGKKIIYVYNGIKYNNKRYVGRLGIDHINRTVEKRKKPLK